jgi:HEPN domain-containing protein
MKNVSLITDYITRAEHRLAAVRLLAERESWADVVRESQEVVELCLKALLRSARVEVPRIHDVSKILRAETSRLPKAIRPHVGRLADISHSMRRDRELAFYGSEDLTPSEFYEEKDGEAALDQAAWVFRTVHPVLKQR